MASNELALVAHLMRRAGFGASRAEMDRLARRGYDAVVDDLVHPERFPDVEMDIIERYNHARPGQTDWIYRMVNTGRPLREKMALFFHHVFATANYKSDNPQASYFQLDMFRETCMTSVINVLTRLSKDPAMLFWLDNNENHREEINENYGRELLELFSMGVGNYTEADIKSASRAFTGWTFTTNVPGKIYPSRFVFRADDHDDGVKTFMGHTGRLNGEDIVEIISRQPATARFFARHLYTFFVADEPPVSSWNEIPPGNPAAIDTLVKAYMDSVGDLRHILRVLFTSDFFKNSLFLRVKSPAEMVVGVIKMLDDYKLPAPQFAHYGTEAGKMGQRLMNPNTVEGWITGSGWIDGGTLNNRVNFAVNEVSDPTKPAIQALALALAAHRRPVPPPDLVEGCLDFAGPLPVSHQTRAGLLRHAETQGSARPDPEELANRISDLLRLIVATREYQFG